MSKRAPFLYLTVLVIATAGLVYELLSGAIATTVLGNSLRQYSITIGVYLCAMGLGAYLSRFIDRRVCERFVDLQFATGVIGGSQGLLLFLAYGHAEAFALYLYGSLLVVGTLVGLEIPLLMRILREDLEFKDLVAKVLTFDYLGSLLGSLLFSIVLVEYLMVPLERIGLIFGLTNCAAGLFSIVVLADQIHPRRRLALRVRGALSAGILASAVLFSGQLRVIGEQGFYGQRVILAQHSAHQRIVLTSDGRTLQMFLDGNLQWTSLDEYRYHEALVHPAMALGLEPPVHAHRNASVSSTSRHRLRVLVLGGGDGLAVRELIRYERIEHIDLVDLDPAVTRMAQNTPSIRQLNGDAFADPRVHIHHDDALVFLDRFTQTPYDVVLADFPDPNNFSLGKLYTAHFYRLLAGAMAEDATLAVQSTSPLFARKSFWCIEHSLRAAGFYTAPYHVPVPSFGEWGYVLAKRKAFSPPNRLAVHDLRFLNDAILPSLFVFAEDIAPVATEVNQLHHQILVQYYSHESDY